MGTRCVMIQVGMGTHCVMIQDGMGTRCVMIQGKAMYGIWYALVECNGIYQLWTKSRNAIMLRHVYDRKTYCGTCG